ncbi:hypothetical protein Tco_0895037, partial [Tanacetum coccineum]
MEKCATLIYKCAALGAISALGPKIKVVENSFSGAWPPESRQTEFICSSYGQNRTGTREGDLCDLFYLRSMDRGTANVPYLLVQYLFRHFEGRKSGARLFGGHFIGRLAAHFGLLGRLNICERIGNAWAWVAPGQERQSYATFGAPRAAEDAPTVDEGAQANLAPVQAPQPPPPVPRTMQQRITRLEEEVHELRWSIMRLRGDVDRLITNQGGFTTWMVSYMTQLMDASGRTHQAFDNTLVGSSQLPYQRRTKRRTGDASTSAPQQPHP